MADDGVLDAVACVEFGADAAVAMCGGCSIQPWRRDWTRTRARGLRAVADPGELTAGVWAQAVVHLQRSRDGLWADLAAAWALLAPGARLLLCGGNDLGIVAAGRRLGAELGQVPRVLANRARARILAFVRDGGRGPEAPADRFIAVPGLGAPLLTTPGGFAHGRLDRGSARLLAALAERDPPRMVLDCACGTGVLGCVAGRRWPEACLVFADGDARALRCLRRNLARLGLDPRSTVHWWDAAEDLAVAGADLVLLNPPCHVGGAVDLAPARAMFERLPSLCHAAGEALIVANRRLPYEGELGRLGRCAVVDQGDGFKLLSWRPGGGP